MVILLCTVRECHAPLAREERRLVCARNHSFDVARSGYINLLQPQDRRSRTPGDSADAVAARRRFLDRGFTQPLTEGLLGFAGSADTALDVGCGEGHDLGAIRHATEADAHGVDISVSAIDAAARRHRDCTFVVANADRFLPYVDESFALVTSITARMNAPELRRVLRGDGRLIVAVPAPDDVLELRAAVLGDAITRDRTPRTIETFAPHFTLERQSRVRHVAHLDPAAIADVMSSSYRGLRTRERERLSALGSMDVTLSRDLLLFAPR